MAVNTSIYGTSEQWRNTAFYDKFYQNKKANFGDNTTKLGDGVTKGKLSYTEPIDISLSYCGLGTESALSHIRYVQNVGGTATIIDSQDRVKTDFLFGEITTQTGVNGDYNYLELSDLKYQKAWQANFDTDTWWSNNKNKLVEPYTSIHPKSVVFLIYVIAANTTFTNSINVTLYEYRSQYTAYPNILQVYIAPYMNDSSAMENSPSRTQYGAAGNITSNNRQGFCLGLLNEYEIPSRNFSMYSYQLTWLRVVMGNLYSTDVTERSTATAITYVPENVGEHFKYQRVNIYDYNYIRTYIEYYDGIIDEILKTVACFGLFFTEKTNVAQRGLFTDSDMYIGVLDSQGVGHGQYYKGADNVRAPQIRDNWEDMSAAGYDPHSQYIDYDTSSHYGILSYYNFNKMYSVTNEQVELLYRELTAAMSAKPNDMTETDYSKGTFLTNDPIDCIISLRKYPIVSTTSSSSVHDIYFGGYKSALSAPYANNAETIRYEFTGIKAFTSKYGGGFLDKEGYTTAELFVPFCGSVKLPVNEFIDRTLSVKLIVDYLTGTCTAYIELDGIPRMTINGSIGVDVPVTGIQTNDLQNTINRNIANLKTAQITAGMTARSGASIASGSGSATSAIMSAVNMINPIAIANKMDSTEKALISRDIAEYNLYHTEIPFKAVSAGDALTAGMGEWSCRLSITRPVLSPDYLADPSVYAKTIGYACLKTGKVSDFSGLTVGTIDLSGINCTDKEKAMIIQAFKSGVYL